MVRIAYKGGAQPVVGKNMRALHEVRMEFSKRNDSDQRSDIRKQGTENENRQRVEIRDLTILTVFVKKRSAQNQEEKKGTWIIKKNQ